MIALPTQTLSLLTMGFGLGLLHALDPDHVLAVANLGDARAGRRATLSFCARWALGHGAALLVIGALVLLAGMAVPSDLSAAAEHLVGWVLIALGVTTLWRLWAGEAPVQWHCHGVDGAHLHVAGLPAHQGRRALLVGLLHGTAGSAALLVLAPLASAANPWLGMSYLVLFALGVLAAMLAFGGVLGAGLRHLRGQGAGVASGLRILVALAAMAFGLSLLRAG
ncbi:MAG: sulfite exporter TauE/SafE family protein [Gammaproteobacteria bacterium]|nr:sulfite exporter TauE/SafE family protein [Gammaproteobacteria bacterium]